MKYIWDFINSRLVIGTLIFLLIGYIGKELTNNYQNSTKKQDTYHEVFKQEIEEAKKTIEKVNFNISQRAYSIQKIHWKLESYNLQEAQKEYEKYEKVKDNWNETVRIYRNKLKRLVDEELAYSLLNSNTTEKRAIHSYFTKTHNLTKDWLKCLKNGSKCSNLKERQDKAHKALNELYIISDLFIDKSYSIFLKKYKTIQKPSENMK